MATLTKSMGTGALSKAMGSSHKPTSNISTSLFPEEMSKSLSKLNLHLYIYPCEHFHQLAQFQSIQS